MIARGQSGNIGALGKRIMRLPFSHRIGLTATPARKNPGEAFDVIKWASGTKELGSKASFTRSFSGFGSGTNAADTAINKTYFSAIQPYVSGSKITHPTFKTTYESLETTRTPQQVERQKEIEARSANFIATRRQEIMSEVRTNPGHRLHRGENWESVLPRRATEEARKEVELQHQDNMDGGEWNTNGRMRALRENLEKDRSKKHVIYIDSKTQRNSLMNMLIDMGYGRNEIKNIAATTTDITGVEMGNRVKAFKENPRVNIMLIDALSSTGFNLNIGDQLHFIGDPASAATYVQAQGRIARMPRKGDVDIKTYKYSDDVSEQARWDSLDTQIKVLRAVSPGMFS